MACLGGSAPNFKREKGTPCDAEGLVIVGLTVLVGIIDCCLRDSGPTSDDWVGWMLSIIGPILVRIFSLGSRERVEVSAPPFVVGGSTSCRKLLQMLAENDKMKKQLASKMWVN